MRRKSPRSLQPSAGEKESQDVPHRLPSVRTGFEPIEFLSVGGSQQQDGDEARQERKRFRIQGSFAAHRSIYPRACCQENARQHQGKEDPNHCGEMMRYFPAQF
jgi:hypothetical protein